MASGAKRTRVGEDEQVKSVKTKATENFFKVPRKVSRGAVSLLSYGTADLGVSINDGDSDIKTPTIIPAFNLINLSDIKAAHQQNALISINKQDKTELWTWGWNDFTHVLGREGTNNVPLTVPFFEDKEIVEVSVGQYHMAALDTHGNVYCWGSYKSDDFLGLFPNCDGPVKVPQIPPQLTKIKFKHIASAGNYTVAITENDEIYQWGCTSTYKTDALLGLTPHKVPVPDNMKPQQVVCGQVHTILYLADAKGNRAIACWGFNQQGQLGLGHFDKVMIPTKIEGLPSNVCMIACGDFHNIALTENGTVYGWGRSSVGQCANNNDTLCTPNQITFFNNLPNNEHVVSIGCGSNHSFAVTNTGTVYGWGCTSEWQLGVKKEVYKPILIPLPTTHHCLQATGGTSHSIFITTSKPLSSYTTQPPLPPTIETLTEELKQEREAHQLLKTKYIEQQKSIEQYQQHIEELKQDQQAHELLRTTFTTHQKQYVELLQKYQNECMKSLTHSTKSVDSASSSLLDYFSGHFGGDSQLSRSPLIPRSAQAFARFTQMAVREEAAPTLQTQMMPPTVTHPQQMPVHGLPGSIQIPSQQTQMMPQIPPTVIYPQQMPVQGQPGSIQTPPQQTQMMPQMPVQGQPGSLQTLSQHTQMSSSSPQTPHTTAIDGLPSGSLITDVNLPTTEEFFSRCLLIPSKSELELLEQIEQQKKQLQQLQQQLQQQQQQRQQKQLID